MELEVSGILEVEEEGEAEKWLEEERESSEAFPLEGEPMSRRRK